jgi:hypothetical protein
MATPAEPARASMLGQVDRHAEHRARLAHAEAVDDRHAVGQPGANVSRPDAARRR